MLIDGLVLTEGSQSINLVVANGTNFPLLPNPGELFYQIDVGLFFYDGSQWIQINTLLNGKISESQLPSIAITDVFVIASELEMLTLVAEKGDVAVRTDNGKSYILAASPASSLSNWIELSSAASGSGPVGPTGATGPVGPTGPMGPAGSGSGSFDPLGKPSAISYTYNADGLVSMIISTYGSLDLVETFVYNADDTVHQIASSYNGITKTETYTYAVDGSVSSISVS